MNNDREKVIGDMCLLRPYRSDKDIGDAMTWCPVLRDIDYNALKTFTGHHMQGQEHVIRENYRGRNENPQFNTLTNYCNAKGNNVAYFADAGGNAVAKEGYKTFLSKFSTNAGQCPNSADTTTQVYRGRPSKGMYKL